MRMAIRADVNRQPGPYMWVQLAESPLGLGQLYVRKRLQRKRKVEIYGKVGGKLKKFGFWKRQRGYVSSMFPSLLVRAKNKSEWRGEETSAAC
jgi:hypothetical protein